MERLTWNKADIAACRVVNDLLKDRNLSNRAVDQLTHGQISYGRLYKARRMTSSPFRVGELLLIFKVCKADPVKEWKKILDLSQNAADGSRKVKSISPMRQISSLLTKAQHIARESIAEEKSLTVPQKQVESTEEFVKGLRLMANNDPNRDIESETPDD